MTAVIWHLHGSILVVYLNLAEKKTHTMLCICFSSTACVCVYSPIQCRQIPPGRFEYTKTTTINNFNTTPQIISVNEMCSGLSHFSGWEDSWCAEKFCRYISLFSAEITIIVTALLCGDVNTTSSWCCVSSLKPFSMVMPKIVFPSQLKQLVIIVQSVLNLSKKKRKKKPKTEMPLRR